MLLEDEPLIAMDVEMLLGGAGFDVSCVASCRDAHSWLDRHLPDVVIVDIKLSDGHCTDFVARLIEANIPFVVHSGDTVSMHADTPFSHGTWVNKPCAGDELVFATSEVLAKDWGLLPLET